MARTYDIGCDPNFHISFFTLTCTKGRITSFGLEGMHMCQKIIVSISMGSSSKQYMISANCFQVAI